MHHLYECVDELHVELSEAKSRVKEARKDTSYHKKKLNKANTVAAKRLDLLKSLKTSLNETKDELEDESHTHAALERMSTIQINIKKERPVGRPGGSKRWTVYIVLLICGMLVNGTHPTSVPANIQSSCALFTGVEATEMPCVNSVRQCRLVLQYLNETLSAFRLGNTDSWHQFFTDGTKRRQIAFQNIVIALMEDGDLDLVIVSQCMYVEN